MSPGSIDTGRLYRAYVSPLSAAHPELTVFCEASSREGAHRRICALVALITCRRLDDVVDAVSNVYSAQQLLDEGMSVKREWRLFECGWSRGSITYVDAPLFLLANPLPLLQAWRAAVPDASEELPHCALVSALVSREGY